MLLSLFQEDGPETVLENVIGGLENWCIEFNVFIITFFMYLKYIFVIFLITAGILTLLRLRGIYFNLNIYQKKKGEDEEIFKKERVIMGTFFIFLGLGILFNYLTYFLIWALDPLPDRFIFNFMNFNGDIDPNYMNRVEDINASEYPHEKTIYFCFALASFYGFINLIFCFYMYLNYTGTPTKPRRVIFWLMKSLTFCILFGFTTSLPLFL